MVGRSSNFMDKLNQKQRKLIHIGFEIGLLMKGIDGLLEIIGSILLKFIDPVRMNRLVHFFTQGELSEDPKDFVANTLIRLASSFSIDTQSFGVFYLMTHGIVKCIIILLLWRRKLWAYPVSVISLVLFIVYQIYRYTITPSIWLILLSIFDLIMILLTYLEYQRMKQKLPLA
jgi:uncharacterized membrane protein